MITKSGKLSPEELAEARAARVRVSPPATPATATVRGLGDVIERIVHPIAKAINWPCLDKEKKQLKPESPCAKARNFLNKKMPLGEKKGLHPIPKPE